MNGGYPKKIRNKKIDTNEFMRGLLDASRTSLETSDGGNLSLTKKSLLLVQLVRIEAITLQIANSNGDCFEAKGETIKANKLGEQILIALQTEMEALDDYIDKYEFSPGTSVFLEEFQKIEARKLIWFNPNPTITRQVVCNKLNATISRIRERINTPAFRKKINNFKRKSDKNLTSIKRYISKCFDLHSRLLVIRIDLSYKKEALLEKSFIESFEMAQQHWRKWIRRFKINMGKAYVGFARILEYGIEKSFHFHVLLLLDGSLVREDIVIAKLAGKDWEEAVTQGKGRHHNCNLRKDAYPRLGIGMIHADDKSKRGVLDEIMAYMVKIDYFMKLVTPDGSRTFSKGDMPKAKLKSGRPRKTSTA